MKLQLSELVCSGHNLNMKIRIIREKKEKKCKMKNSRKSLLFNKKIVLMYVENNILLQTIKKITMQYLHTFICGS